MPTPFQCRWCDKPTMNETGICIDCEQRYEEGNKDIAATVRELETKVRRYEKGIKEILDCWELYDTFGRSSEESTFAGDVKDIAQALLDGEPTTADEHNTMQEDEKLVYEEEHNLSPENTVRISDVNKEIAKEWNRDREEKIKKKANMIESIGYRGEE
jgi:hypothetical protein